MVKATITNTQTNKTREAVGVGGLFAVCNLENELEGRATIFIENDFTEDSKGRAEMKATIKEILKTGLELDRKMLVQAVYEAFDDEGFLSKINGVPVIVFRGVK